MKYGDYTSTSTAVHALLSGKEVEAVPLILCLLRFAPAEEPSTQIGR